MLLSTKLKKLIPLFTNFPPKSAGPELGFTMIIEFRVDL